MAFVGTVSQDNERPMASHERRASQDVSTETFVVEPTPYKVEAAILLKRPSEHGHRRGTSSLVAQGEQAGLQGWTEGAAEAGVGGGS